MKPENSSPPSTSLADIATYEVPAAERVPLAQCRELLPLGATDLPDEAVLAIRDLLYAWAAIGWQEYQQKQGQAVVVPIENHKPSRHEKSHYLRAG